MAPAAVLPAKPVRLPAVRLHELAGTTLSHFEVGPVVARGQTGIVFHARDFKDERVVALKVLWPEFSRADDEKRRFIRAMKTMLPVRYPNLVTVYNAGKTGPYCWIAMEYVEGESLTGVIRRIGVANMLDWRYALRVADHVAQALAFAHQRQIVHRNIQPSNILVQHGDKVSKLGDLMLAKALEGGLAEQITRPGELLGDVRYLSPEQTGGSRTTDARSDIYGLGGRCTPCSRAGRRLRAAPWRTPSA